MFFRYRETSTTSRVAEKCPVRSQEGSPAQWTFGGNRMTFRISTVGMPESCLGERALVGDWVCDSSR